MVVSELASKPASTADMSLDEAERVFSAILDGDMPLDEAGDLLVALSRRGESEDEILGCVRAMMRRVEPSDFGPLDPIDIGGTGGDRLGTFNISTTAAFVVAGAGVPVLKHGNRGFSSRSGSADMVEALGIALPRLADHAHVRACLDGAGLAYLFTPAHHRFPDGLNALRKRLGIRTIFNLAGPLAHPARLRRQMVGVSADLTRREFELIQLLADARGQVMQREEIYQRVWGYAMVHGDRSVDVFVRKLRQKLEKVSPGWRYIHTHFGIGYRFTPERIVQP